MAELGVRSDSFSRRYSVSTKKLVRLAGAILKEMTPDALHDLRVKVRRVQMMVKLLPRDARDTKQILRFESALKSLLRATSKLRDLDSMLSTLDTFKASLPPGFFASLTTSRTKAEASSKAAILEFSKAVIPNSSQFKLDSRKLSRKLRRQACKRKQTISGLLRKAARDESKVKALHSLRLQVKKLRYLLEIAGGKPRELEALPKWQDMLGRIHDLDMTLVFLESSAKRPLSEVQGELSRARHMEYQRFLSQSKADTADVLKTVRR